MTGSLLLTAALMGFAGAAHCAGMCSAACGVAASRCVPQAPARGLVMLLISRAVAYATAGVLVGLAAETLRWLIDTSVWLKPLWTVAQVALLVLGLWLLFSGELPPSMVQWAERMGRRRSASVHKVYLPGEMKAAAAGALWPLLPCGLLHAALALSALASSPVESMLMMAAFATTSSLGLVAGQALWRRLAPTAGVPAVAWGGRPAIRLAGAGIAVVCLWPLLQHVWAPLQAAWCG